MITYRKSKGKIVICNNGVYMSLTKEQLSEIKLVIEDIEAGEKKLYKEDSR